MIITEIGGTVGDIESQPFLEAARQLRQDVGRENVFFLHVSLVPYIGPSQELKTKPTQHSVAALRSLGIQPDGIVLRSDRELPADIRGKISRMCDVDADAVINCADAPSIYDIPRILHKQAMDAYVVQALDLKFKDVDWSKWNSLLSVVHHPDDEVEVALVGKYIDLPDAYLSVTEALRAGGFANSAKTKIRWVPSDLCSDQESAAKALAGVDAICVPGGFGVRGLDGKIGALRYARENGVPTLGLCLGLQTMVMEYARNVVGLPEANSTEFDPDTKFPVIATMAEQETIVATRATWAEPCGWAPTTRRWSKAPWWPRRTGPPRSRNVTGTAMRSTTPTASSSLRLGWCSPEPARTALSWSSWSCPGVAPLLRLHAGAPRAEVPAHQPSPAVRLLIRAGLQRRSAR